MAIEESRLRKTETGKDKNIEMDDEESTKSLNCLKKGLGKKISLN